MNEMSATNLLSLGPRENRARLVSWRHRRHRIGRAAWVAALLSLALTSGDGKTPPPSPRAIIPVSEVREGMPVVAQTVFQGTAIETFAGHVVGVLHGYHPGRDLIIVRFEGDRIEESGVAAGMSGSPVYVGERLMGAISYKMSPFPRDLTAGVTPAEYMVREARTDAGTLTARNSVVGDDGGPAAPVAAAAVADSPLSPRLEPLATPLVASGLHPLAEREFARELSRVLRGPIVMPALAGSGSAHLGAVAGDARAALQSPAVEGAPLAPGSPIAGVMAWGDVSLAATGTVTRIEGDRVFAFGHPFLYQGSIRLPMAKAEIVATLSDQSSPYKLANIGRIVGTIDSDGLTAISGTVGQPPELIPVTVRITHGGALVDTVRTMVFEHVTLTPVILRQVVLSAMYYAPLYNQQSTYRVFGRVAIGGDRTLAFDQVYSSNGGSTDIVPQKAAADLGDVFGGLYTNRFTPPRIESVELTVDVSSGHRAWRVTGLLAASTRIQAGKPMNVLVELEAFRGEHRLETVTLELPANLRGTPLRVWAGCASALVEAGVQLGGSPRELATARTLDQIIGALNRRRSDDQVYVVAERSAPGAVIQHQLLPTLPVSMLSLMDVPELGGSAEVDRWIVSSASVSVERAIVKGRASLTVIPQ